MRAAAILGTGSSPKDLARFQTQEPMEWRMGLPSTAEEVAAVLLFGGDGTIHRHLRQLVELQLPVLVVPTGSGNDFARALGFRSVRDSLQSWRRFCAGEGNVGAIDLGVIAPVNGDMSGVRAPGEVPTYFCSVAGMGLDSEVARRAGNLPRWLRGHGGYIFSLMSSVIPFVAFRTKISMRDDAGCWAACRDQPTLLTACANTAIYGGGMKIAPEARPDDGQLDICVIGDIDPFRFFCRFPTVYFGKHLRMREVSYFKSPGIRIETEMPVDVYADGEFVCHTPVEIGVQPAALKVLAP
jgi:diacylglycerol kinase (ATP)